MNVNELIFQMTKCEMRSEMLEQLQINVTSADINPINHLGDQCIMLILDWYPREQFQVDHLIVLRVQLV